MVKRWILIGGFFWLIVGVAGGPFQGKLSEVQRNSDTAFLPANAQSTEVATLSREFGQSTIPGSVVFFRPSGLSGSDLAAVQQAATAMRGVPGVAGAEVSGPRISADGTVAVLSVPLRSVAGGTNADDRRLVDAEKSVLRTARQLAPEGVVVHGAGPAGQLTAIFDAFSGLESTLLFVAVGVVVVILLLVYRSAILWLLPLFSALVALGASALVVYPLAKHGVLTLNGQSQGILSVLVIGAGTDYALLLISRYREELHHHERRWPALMAAWRGVVRPIAASASTVIAGLLCLLLGELNSDRSLGPVCAIGIACTAFVMLSVLPLLLLLGRWIFWPRIPRFVDRAPEGVTASGGDGDGVSSGLWKRIADVVIRHSRPIWVVSGLVLFGLASATTTLRADGIPQTQAFTRAPDAVLGERILDAHFPGGASAPLLVVANADRAAQVIAAIRTVPGVSSAPGSVCVAPDYAKLASGMASSHEAARNSAGCVPPSDQVDPVDGRTLLQVSMAVPYDSPQASNVVREVRRAVSGVAGADALVGGQAALTLDTLDAAAHDRDVVIPVVLVVTTLIIGLVLRALLATLVLLATVVVSFTATLGVCALVFNHVFHFAGADPSFPLFAFIFLVALGVDYNIFLMTRVREEILRDELTRGIARGLAATGGVITSAGVVLAATFGVLGVVPLVALAEVGFAVAFGVLLDTLVVRTALLPALVAEIGPRAWWPTQVRCSRRGA